MKYILSPWIWDTSGLEPAWVAPVGTVGAIDLRSIADCSLAGAPGSRPFGFFAVGNGFVVGSESILLGVGDLREISANGRVQSAWRSATGYRPQGDKLSDLLFDQLTNGSSLEHDETVMPLMPSQKGVLAVSLRGHQIVKSERFAYGSHAHTSKVREMVRRAFEREHDSVVKGRAPDGHQQRVLDYELEKYRIPKSQWQEFVPTSLRREISGPLPHQTSYADDFNRANEDPLGTASGGFTWSNISVSNQHRLESNQGTHGVTSSDAYRVSTTPALSGFDQYAQVDLTGTNAPDSFRTTMAGTVVRCVDINNYYAVQLGYSNSSSGLHRILKRVSGTVTVLVSDSSLGTFSLPLSCRIEVDGSSLLGYRDGVEELSVTDTSLPYGSYAGVHTATSSNIASDSTQFDNFICGDLADLLPSYNKQFGKGNHVSADPALEGHWELQDDAANTDVLDSSGNANDLTLTNTYQSADVSTTGPNTWLPKALAFATDMAAEGAVASAFDTLEEISLSAWANASSFGGEGRGRIIQIGNTDVSLYVDDFSVTDEVKAFVEDTTAALDDAESTGVWNHWGLDYDGTTIRIYKNGVEVASTAKTGAIGIGTNTLLIGNDPTETFGFEGDIAGAAAFTRSRSAAEWAEETAGPEPYLLSGTPTISGTVSRGSTITLDPGVWSTQSNGTPTYHYRLYSYSDTSGSDPRLEKYTSTALTSQDVILKGAALVGRYLRLQITVENDGGLDPQEVYWTSYTAAVGAGSDPTYESYNALFGKGKHLEDANLVGLWKLDEASGQFLDSSTNERHLTTTGTVTHQAEGPQWMSHAAGFTSSGHLSTAVETLSGYSAFGGWFYNDSAAAGIDQLYGGIVTGSTGGSAAIPRIRRNNGTSIDWSGWGFIDAKAVNTWHNFGVTWNGVAGNDDYTYYDGSLDRTHNTSASNAIDTLFFGTDTLSTGVRNHYGRIAHVWCIHREVLATEHLQIYSGPEPLNITAPSFTGTLEVGETLTAVAGTFDSQSNGTVDQTYSWYASDDTSGTGKTPIGTGATYELTSSEEDKYITIVARGANDGGYDEAEDTESAYSAIVTAGAGGDPPVNTVAPTISGSTVVGNTLSGTNGTWTGDPTIVYTYQWQRSDDGGAPWVDVSGAESIDYTTVDPADLNDYFRLAVIGTNSFGFDIGYSNVIGTIGEEVTYDFTLESGSYTLSGQVATFSKDYILPADSGNYQISGQIATFIKDEVFSVDYGNYLVSGQSVTISKNPVFALDAGSYEIIGQETNFLSDTIFPAEYGNYSITGQTVQFLQDRIFSADQGNYLVEGQVLTFGQDGKITLDTGNYVITGQDLGIHREMLFEVQPGYYQVIGEPATFQSDYTLLLEQGNYLLSGSTANFNSLLQYRVLADFGNYQINGSPLFLNRDTLFSIDSGSYLLTGYDLGFTKDQYIFMAEHGVYVVVGQAANLQLIIAGTPYYYHFFVGRSQNYGSV